MLGCCIYGYLIPEKEVEIRKDILKFGITRMWGEHKWLVELNARESCSFGEMDTAKTKKGCFLKKKIKHLRKHSQSVRNQIMGVRPDMTTIEEKKKVTMYRGKRKEIIQTNTNKAKGNEEV